MMRKLTRDGISPYGFYNWCQSVERHSFYNISMYEQNEVLSSQAALSCYLLTMPRRFSTSFSTRYIMVNFILYGLFWPINLWGTIRKAKIYVTESLPHKLSEYVKEIHDL